MPTNAGEVDIVQYAGKYLDLIFTLDPLIEYFIRSFFIEKYNSQNTTFFNRSYSLYMALLSKNCPGANYWSPFILPNCLKTCPLRKEPPG